MRMMLKPLFRSHERQERRCLILLNHPRIIEVFQPPFIKLNAGVQIIPVMSGDDLRKGFANAGGA
jgi:hypothetical protein